MLSGSDFPRLLRRVSRSKEPFEIQHLPHTSQVEGTRFDLRIFFRDKCAELYLPRPLLKET